MDPRTALHHSVFWAALLCLYSCKTAEQIRREKTQDTLLAQMEHVRGQSTQQAGQLQEQQQRLGKLLGQWEETRHAEKQQIQRRDQETNARLEALENKLVALEEQNRVQADFIKKVTHQLKQLRGRSSRKKARKSAQGSDYQKAMDLYKQKKDKQAQELFLQVLGRKNLAAAQWAYSHHALGIMSFRKKDYQQAMVHLSKVYTKYPRSSKSPNALLHIGKSFIATGQTPEAKQSLEQLGVQYPKAKEAKAAQKLLQGLP